jgi:histone H3/H4
MANTEMKSESKASAQAAEGCGRGKPLPKDAQVMVAILKDMGITEYEPRVVNQMLEFSYRYVTNIVNDAKVMSSHAHKKAIDVEDVKLAVQMYSEQNLTSPPSRDLLLDFARAKNAVPLPVPRPTCGLRLPPDRHCLTACNYRLRNTPKPRPPGVGMKAMGTGASGSGSPKFVSLPQHPQHGGGPSFSVIHQNQGANKPIIKINPGAPSSLAGAMPKFQISAAPPGMGGAPMPAAQQPLFKISVNPQTLQTNTQPIKRKAEEMDGGGHSMY